MTARRKSIHHSMPENRFDLVIEWLLIALLIFSPLAFGSVDAWSEEIVLVLASAMTITLLTKLIVNREQRFIWSWTYVPVLIFISIVVLQILPLPGVWVRVLSPAAYRIQMDHPPGVAPRGSTLTLSLYPAETLHELRLLLAVCIVFIASVNTLRRSVQIVRLLMAVVVIGVVEAIINLLQYISGTQKVLWIVPMAHPYSGTFAGHAHFGQLINLSCGAMIAIALVIINENKPRENRKDEKALVSRVRSQLPPGLAAGALHCDSLQCHVHLHDPRRNSGSNTVRLCDHQHRDW